MHRATGIISITLKGKMGCSVYWWLLPRFASLLSLTLPPKSIIWSGQALWTHLSEILSQKFSVYIRKTSFLIYPSMDIHFSNMGQFYLIHHSLHSPPWIKSQFLIQVLLNYHNRPSLGIIIPICWKISQATPS